MRTLKRLKYITGHLPRLPNADQKSVLRHARWRGIEKYDFTKSEYERLRNLAVKLHLGRGLIAEFDKDFRFMYKCPKLMRIGRFSAITGICYDIAICNYAEIAEKIKKTRQDYDVS